MVAILFIWLALTVPRQPRLPINLPINLHARILQLEDERNLNGAELTDLLRSNSPMVRERVALALGRIGDRRATPLLLEAIERERVDAVRRMIVFALGELEDPRAVPLLQRLVGPEKVAATLKARAAEALGKIGELADRSTVARLVAAQLPPPTDPLTDEQVHLTSLVITALLRLRATESVAPLAAQLRSTRPEVRAAAANALARLRAPLTDIVPDLMTALGDDHPDVRANAARALGVAQDVRAAVTLTSLLRDRDDRVVVSAARALGALRQSQPARPLVELGQTLLASQPNQPPRPGLLNEIAAILGNLRDEQGLPFLRALRSRLGIGASPEVETALAAFGPTHLLAAPGDQFSSLLSEARKNQGIGNLARGLAVAGDQQSRELLLLLWAAEPPTSTARPEILRALGKTQPQLLRTILTEALRGPDPITRATAAELLAAAEGDSPVPQLVEALSIARQDRVNDARLAILRALARHTDPAATKAIESGLNDPDHLVRRLAVDLLRARGAGDQTARLGIVGTLRRPGDYLDLARRLNRGTPLRARISTDRGLIELELFHREAPLTVDNLVSLARRGYFNGLTFHRVVPNFVIQGGDPRGDGEGGPGYQIRCEINTRPYLRGTLGMALSGKDTGGSQFFITHSPQPHLDGGYTVFGQVVRGLETVDLLDRGDRIIALTIIEKGIDTHRDTPRRPLQRGASARVRKGHSKK
ncbi:MAG: peptidylprolyl isomerase [Acidobacteriota bacterium]